MKQLAKLFIDDKEYPLLDCDFSFNQPINAHNNKPSGNVNIGLVYIRFIMPKEDTITRWVHLPTMQKDGEIVFYPANGLSAPIRLKFGNAYSNSVKGYFNAHNNEPTSITLQISAGIISLNDVVFETNWNPSNPFAEQTPVTVREETQEEVIEEVKFIAKLERPDDYKGEFGFDWMRGNYKDISEDYEKLKKEYTPITIEGEEYFVPWLNMFPNQKNVVLTLAIDIKEGTATDQDIIKLSTKDGIRFEPEELKVSEANGTKITIHCDSPLRNDTKIELLDKNDAIVGKINVFKNANHEQLHFEITPVRILRGIVKESDAEAIENRIDHPQGFGDTSKDINGDLQNLQDYLNTQSLNQALLQCKIGEVYDVVIDEQKWINDDLIIEEKCVFKGEEILKNFQNEFEKQYPKIAKKRGLILFLSPIGAEKIGGKGELNDIDGKTLAVFISNLKSKDTFAHEIGHVIGLTHSFQEWANQEIINKTNEYIKDVDDYFQELIDNNNTKDFIGSEWKIYKKSYAEDRSYLNLYYRNPYIFDQATNENFMDYETLTDENDIVVRRNSKSRLSFWKYQWKAMQDDVLKFYNKK